MLNRKRSFSTMEDKPLEPFSPRKRIKLDEIIDMEIDVGK